MAPVEAEETLIQSETAEQETSEDRRSDLLKLHFCFQTVRSNARLPNIPPQTSSLQKMNLGCLRKIVLFLMETPTLISMLR